MPPFLSLSCYITWFAHNLVRLGDAARLFDLFLGSHPIMPIYAAAAILVVSLLACPIQLNLRLAMHDVNGRILQRIRSPCAHLSLLLSGLAISLTHSTLGKLAHTLS